MPDGFTTLTASGMDTARNIEASGEFVVNVATEANMEVKPLT
jgi:flavin reductase (DIM6/NTAB) family NADH-FMN oxidoreductase RutF